MMLPARLRDSSRASPRLLTRRMIAAGAKPDHVVSLVGVSFGMDKTLRLALAQLLRLLLEEKRRELHRLDAHAPPRAPLGCYLFQPVSRARWAGGEAPFSPTGIGGPATARWHAEAGFDVGQQL